MTGGRHADIYAAALAAVDPSAAVAKAISLSGARLTIAGAVYDLARFERIIVIGAGKASARMALAVEQLLGDRISGGLIVVKYGHGAPLRSIRVAEAGHPIPDDAGAAATRAIMDLVSRADEKTLVLCLLSGGGSALLVAPAEGISLEDKQKTTGLLLRTGAAIHEVNTVRKRLSAVKGGKLARIAYPASIATLILSDVIGDRLDVIASGPTVPDPTTFADALAVVGKFGVASALPKGVLSFLEQGASLSAEKSERHEDDCCGRTRNFIVANLARALAAARARAASLGMDVEIITGELQGDVRAAARYLSAAALRVRQNMKSRERRCLLSGGETTVTVSGTGRGGRNQELALAFALEIEGIDGISLLSAGTDGTDGPTDAAGAHVDGSIATVARAHGLSPEAYLENNDSYSFFQQYDSQTGEKRLLITGPTGTNVMDIQIILIER